MVQPSQPDTDSSTPHTPIPWAVTDSNEHGDQYIGPQSDYVAIVVRSAVGDLPTAANAAFIVRAVNNHVALLLALQRIYDESHDPNMERIAAAAIEEAQS